MPESEPKIEKTPEETVYTGQTDAPETTRGVRKAAYWGAAFDFLLSVVKIALGIVGQSQALIADGIHSFSDLWSDFALSVGVRYWNAPADRKHPHGHARIETIITLFIGIVLVGVAGGIIYNALTSLQEAHQKPSGTVVIIGASLAILTKEGLFRWTRRMGYRFRSRAVIANAWHHRTDALSSVPVLVAVIVYWTNPEWMYVDHVAAILVATLVLRGAWKILVPALQQLTDTGVDSKELERIRDMAKRIQGVSDVHALRTRFAGWAIHVDLHVLVNPELTVERGHAIANEVEEELLSKHPSITDVVVHVEPDREEAN